MQPELESAGLGDCCRNCELLLRVGHFGLGMTNWMNSAMIGPFDHDYEKTWLSPLAGPRPW
jgi:hypothetical protein